MERTPIWISNIDAASRHEKWSKRHYEILVETVAIYEKQQSLKLHPYSKAKMKEELAKKLGRSVRSIEKKLARLPEIKALLKNVPFNPKALLKENQLDRAKYFTPV